MPATVQVKQQLIRILKLLIEVEMEYSIVKSKSVWTKTPNTESQDQYEINPRFKVENPLN